MCATLGDCRATAPESGFRLRRDRGRGLTLVELLVVVSVVSMLMALLLPALGKVRRQARSVIGMRRQSEVVGAVNAYAGDNEDANPPSVATVGVDDSWNWQAPNMLTGCLQRTPGVARSVSTYLHAYITDADVLFCPNGPLRYRHLQAAWDAGDDWDHPETPAVPGALFGSYCLYWNYTGYLGEERGLFRGPSGPNRGYRESSVAVSDFLGYDHWRSRLTHGSCEHLPGAEVVEGTAISSAFWASGGHGTFDELRQMEIRRHAGHVESYSPVNTRAMYVIKQPETSEPYEPGVGPGTFYVSCVGIR